MDLSRTHYHYEAGYSRTLDQTVDLEKTQLSRSDKRCVEEKKSNCTLKAEILFLFV